MLFGRLAEQFGDRHIERNHHSFDHVDSRVATTAFEVVLVSPMDADERGKLILRKTALAAQAHEIDR